MLNGKKQRGYFINRPERLEDLSRSSACSGKRKSGLSIEEEVPTMKIFLLLVFGPLWFLAFLPVALSLFSR
jgi:hypothetical protein